MFDPAVLFGVGLQQLVQVDDDIFHFGVVDGALRGAAPCLFGLFIVRIEADNVAVGEVDEVEALRIADASTEHEMQFAHG